MTEQNVQTFIAWTPGVHPTWLQCHGPVHDAREFRAQCEVPVRIPAPPPPLPHFVLLPRCSGAGQGPRFGSTPQPAQRGHTVVIFDWMRSFVFRMHLPSPQRILRVYRQELANNLRIALAKHQCFFSQSAFFKTPIIFSLNLSHSLSPTCPQAALAVRTSTRSPFLN